MGNQDLKSMPVGVVMSRMPNLITCKPDDTLYHAAVQMMRHQIDSLPVVRPFKENPEQLEVIGRISKTTIVRAFVELGQNKNI
jgi:CBS domain-containing protein